MTGVQTCALPIFISILLGLGLATLFRKVCKDKNCVIFHGPVLSELEDKVYKYGDKCYKYTATPAKCDKKKKIVEINDKENDKPKGILDT